jgi:hypothetical protein
MDSNGLRHLNHLVCRRMQHADWHNEKNIKYYDQQIRKLLLGKPFLLHIIKDGLKAHELHDPQY